MAWKPTDPTHRVRVRRRTGSAISTTVGRAWYNPEKNTMSFQLNPGVVLSWNDDIHIVAFPVASKPEDEGSPCGNE